MLNHMTLQGRLTADPEFSTTNGGLPCANFRIAWSEKYKDRENKCFLPCKAFSGTAEFIQKFMNKKGHELIVEGKLTTEEWESDGQKRSKIVLLVSNAHFSGRRQEESSDTAPAAGTQADTEGLPF